MRKSQYSIKDLENLTSIKAHTIRIWEQRYDLLSPKRTDTNIRYYEDQDLKKLLNINLLYSNGLKISKIASLTDEEIIEESKKLIRKFSNEENSLVELIIMATIDLDTHKVYDILEESFKGKDIEDFYADTIIPLLHRIGSLWQLNSISVGHEHFFSNILREFILSKTAELPIPDKNSKKALLFLHEGEEHEISLFIYHYVLKRDGWNVIYLGARVPENDLEITYNQFKPNIVVTSFIATLSKEDFSKIVQKITSIVPEKDCIFSGYICNMYREEIPDKVRIIESREDLNRYFV